MKFYIGTYSAEPLRPKICSATGKKYQEPIIMMGREKEKDGIKLSHPSPTSLEENLLALLQNGPGDFSKLF